MPFFFFLPLQPLLPDPAFQEPHLPGLVGPGQPLLVHDKALLPLDRRPQAFGLHRAFEAGRRALPQPILSEGTLTASSVYPREVIKAALQHHAAALIFAHNHPSGEPRPSAEDLAITRQLVFAGRVMGITVHEHLIIGDSRYFSFADQGHMARLNSEFEANR